MSQLIATIASELSLAPHQVQGALALFDEGNTLPFIARYRKEATGGLDEIQLRDVRDRALSTFASSPNVDGRDPQEYRGAGQARRRARGSHRRRDYEAGARRSLPAVQAEAPHARDDRA